MFLNSWFIKKQGDLYRALQYRQGHDGMKHIVPGYTGSFIESTDLEMVHGELLSMRLNPAEGATVEAFKKKEPDVLEIWW